MCVCEYWSSPHRHPLPYMVCADPETGTVKKVSAFGIRWKLYPLLEVTSLKKKHVSVKDSNTEGTCIVSKYPKQPFLESSLKCLR